MTGQEQHQSPWRLVASQHGLITRAQLMELGYSRHAIEHRVARGRLHPVHRGVFAVGRRELDRYGRWMAAVLACGPESLVSHQTAAELWGLRQISRRPLEISAPTTVARAPQGVRLHRRRSLRDVDRNVHRGIPTTSPIRTLVDLATRLRPTELEAAVNEADKLGLTDPVALRDALGEMSGQRGVPALRLLLDRQVFRLTDSELERKFLRLAREAGLSPPQTGVRLNGFRVDFFWPELGLVVETDGLRYHRTPGQQGRDRRRDQIHTAAGLTTLRFTHAQVVFESAEVRDVLFRVTALLSKRRSAA